MTARTWVELARVDSTSDFLKREIAAGRLAGAAVIARSQTAGRGRHGRTWLSPEGGLYLTLSTPVLPDAAPVLHAVAAGLGVAEVLERDYEIAARLKWPNDVLVDGHKICGVLAELVPAAKQTYVLLGIGCNLAATPQAPDLEYPPTSLQAETCKEPPLPRELADAIATETDRNLAQLSEQGGEPLLARWRARACTLGMRVRISAPTGVLEGRAIDVRSDFALLIDTGSGTEAVAVGDCLHLVPS